MIIGLIAALGAGVATVLKARQETKAVEAVASASYQSDLADLRAAEIEAQALIESTAKLEDEKEDRLKLYIWGALGLVVVIGLIIILVRRARRKN